jgi:hypothetical protein
MHKKMDTSLRHTLKNWANAQEPPTDGRARLLLLASTSSPKTAHVTSFRRFERYSQPRVPSLDDDIFRGSWMLRLNLA